ncbi:hypothetical protein GCM10025777_18720 [Membranihabitans marinus]
MVLFSCEKDDVLSDAKDFTSYTLTASQNAGIDTDVVGQISGTTISIKIPNSANITSLIPSFETSGIKNIVRINGTVQVSGQTTVDFSSPVTYTIVAEDGSEKTYTVQASRNAAITGFGFYAADNPSVLFKDYVATVTGTDISVDLPVDADRSQLVAQFTTTTGATVAVDGAAQESGVTANDFSSALTYTVSDNDGSDDFTVVVGDLSAPEWSIIGAQGFIEEFTDVLSMAINPVTHLPYLAYQRDGSIGGESIPSAEEKLSVVKYEDGNWSYLGSETGVTEGKVDYVSMAFNSAGEPNVAYTDYNADRKVSVMKYSGDSWSTVGSAGFTEGRSDYTSLGITSDDALYVAISDRSGVTLDSRGLNIYHVQGSDWTTANPPAGALTGYSQFDTYEDQPYLVFMDRAGGLNRPSVYTYTNNAWEAVGSPQFGATDGNGYLKVEIAVKDHDEMYVAYQESIDGVRSNYVMKYDGSDWALIGDPIMVGAERDNFNLALHPNGTVYFGYVDDSGLNIRTFNTNTNNWNDAVNLSAEETEDFDIQVSDIGIPYVAAVIGDDDKTVVWEYDIP